MLYTLYLGNDIRYGHSRSHVYFAQYTSRWLDETLEHLAFDIQLLANRPSARAVVSGRIDVVRLTNRDIRLKIDGLAYRCAKNEAGRKLTSKKCLGVLGISQYIR